MQMANGKNILTFASFTCALCVCFGVRKGGDREGERLRLPREDFSNVLVMLTRTLNPNPNQNQKQKCTMHLKIGWVRG